jgi:hypothetical protein
VVRSKVFGARGVSAGEPVAGLTLRGQVAAGKLDDPLGQVYVVAAHGGRAQRDFGHTARLQPQPLHHLQADVFDAGPLREVRAGVVGLADFQRLQQGGRRIGVLRPHRGKQHRQPAIAVGEHAQAIVKNPPSQVNGVSPDESIGERVVGQARAAGGEEGIEGELIPQ